WILIVPLVIAGWFGLRRREWVWLGVAIYCVYLCLNWPNPNARYMVPLLPLIIWGILEGIRILFVRRPGIGGPLTTVLLWSVVLANLMLLSVDVCIARSGDFYGYYEGGLDQSLISAVKYVRDIRGVNNGELAVSEVYTNLGRKRISKFG